MILPEIIFVMYFSIDKKVRVLDYLISKKEDLEKQRSKSFNSVMHLTKEMNLPKKPLTKNSTLST